MNMLIPILSTLLLLGSVSARAAEVKPSVPIELGKGVNLAHWISQTRRSGAERREFLDESDIARIARLGLDHVRLPMDEMQMWDEQGKRDADGFAIMHDAIRWSMAHGLPVVVDLHILRSHHFNAEEKPLWTDPAEQERFLDLWRDLSNALQDYPPEWVIYELMNEPVADDPDDWNRLVAKAVKALRALEPGRTLMIGSNRWQHADTFDELEVPADDNLILSFHFYEPFLLTHYGTGWTYLKDYEGPVHYPGAILTEQDFAALPDAQRATVAGQVGLHYDREVLRRMMEKPLRKARELGLPLYCGEYGVFDAAPAPDRRRWLEDMLAIFEAEGISSALWNYKSDQFGIVGRDGEPIEAMISVITGH
jgi:endoglucanase